jgi:hypothetical protein
MKEQAPFPPCQGVHKKNQLTDQSDTGVHGNNTDDSSGDELIPTPLASQGVSERGQLVCVA